MNTALAFCRLTRPHFLVGGVLMFAIGAFVARPIDTVHYVIAQLMVTFAQVTAHYVNEYADFEADALVSNRTSFSGGSGVLIADMLPRSVALVAGIATSVMCVTTAALVARFSLIAAILGLMALSVSWAYSMPPVRLLDTGTGEAFTAITVAALVPLIGCLSQHPVPDELWFVMGPLVLMQLTMLIGFELPDLQSDAIAGKRVLGVRLGYTSSVETMAACAIVAYLTELVAWRANLLGGSTLLGSACALPALALLLVSAQRHRYALVAVSSVATFFLMSVGMFCSQL